MPALTHRHARARLCAVGHAQWPRLGHTPGRTEGKVHHVLQQRLRRTPRTPRTNKPTVKAKRIAREGGATI